MDKANIVIQITPEQATALLQLIDAAVKAGGLQVAQAAVFFHTLIQTAYKNAEAPTRERATEASTEKKYATSAVEVVT